MQIPLALTQSASVQLRKGRHSQLKLTALMCLIVLSTLLAISVYLRNEAQIDESLFLRIAFWGGALYTCSTLAFFAYQLYQKQNLTRRKLSTFKETCELLARIESAQSAAEIEWLISDMEKNQASNELIEDLLIYARPLLTRRLAEVRRMALKADVEKHFVRAETAYAVRAQKMYDQHPLVIAEKSIRATLSNLERRREIMIVQWQAHYESLSWWGKLNASSDDYFADINGNIKELKALDTNLKRKHDKDLKKLENYCTSLLKRSQHRLAEARRGMDALLSNSKLGASIEPGMANKALFFAAMSVPVSAWNDVNNAANVYDALRNVNGRYEDSTDLEIWWDTVFMAPERLAGLVSLTKGAYFEQLVANDTGGQLHEHFNTPDTDITIDGERFQIKATNRDHYIDSVDDDITVITTSEIAATTGAIDSGQSNEELNTLVENAIGGTVIDMGDTAVDAVLTGIGGLGIFATLRGISHASEAYDKDGDVEKAVIEGMEVAVAGTARAMVDTAELSYKAINSAPSRFVGRTLLKSAKALYRKISGSS